MQPTGTAQRHKEAQAVAHTPIPTCGVTEGPEVQALRARLTQVRERELEVLCETDDIRMQRNPQLEADYAAKVGFWENRLVEADVAARRAKRRLDLARAAANRGEPPDTAVIESQLDGEFAEWTAKVQQAAERFAALMKRRLNSEPLSPEDAAELKVLYRRAAKLLHPDVDPHPSPEHTRLFALVQQAYAHGDLPALRSLAALAEDAATGGADGPHGPGAPSVEEELACALEVEERACAVFEEKLAELKAAFPYCFAERLADASWVRDQVEQLKDRIDEAQDAQRGYDGRYRQIVGEGERQ
jgi:hypothetical protein